MLKSGIYKIVNNINGKIYIGQSVDIRKRFGEHVRNSEAMPNHLYKSIRKYGLYSFNFEIIATLPEFALDHYEKQYISYYRTVDPKYGYNKTTGGSNGRPSEDTKKKMSNSKKGKIPNRIGYSHSKQTREKMSNAHKSKKYIFTIGCESFNSLMEICDFFHISKRTLNRRIANRILIIKKELVV